MPLATVVIPAETDILCESCGYTLNGLPETGNCPECGLPIADSTTRSGRRAPTWETAPKRTPLLFAKTVLAVISSPTRFFRGLSLGGNLPRGTLFARWCHAFAALVFATGFTAHFQFMFGWGLGRTIYAIGGPVRVIDWPQMSLVIAACLGLAGLIYVAARLTGRLVMILTSFEARYWGYRLPKPVVLRGLQYQAAAYLPAAWLVTAWIIAGRIWVESIRGARLTATAYLYILCGTVVVSAVYLFMTYATSMRKLMYANRSAAPDDHARAAQPA